MWLVAGAFAGMACSGEVSSFHPNHDPLDTGDTGERVDYEIGACSSLMIQVETDTLSLGEWDEDWIEPYSENVIAKFDLTVKGFCMDQFPFPGMEGANWPTDGLNGQQIAILHEELAVFGRRTCDTEELMLAAAGADNQRFPTDTEQLSESDCDPDDFNPSPLGTYEACESPLGFRDFQVRSTWSVLDDDVADQLEATLPGYALPVGEGGFGIWGGTSRTDTF